jgi:UDP-glucose 4-epimerase
MSNSIVTTTVLVVGGTGFIGSATVRALVDSGLNVIVGDAVLRETSPVFEMIKSGIVEHRNVRTILDGAGSANDVVELKDVDAILCLYYVGPSTRAVFRTNPTPEHRAQLIQEERQLNHEPVLRLYDAAHTAGVKQFVFTSTIQVHDVQQGGAVSESTPLQPLYPYAEVKLETERALHARFEDGGPMTAVLRFSNVYGVGDRPPRAIPNFIERVQQGKVPEIHGTGEAMSDYVNVSDVAASLVASIQEQATGDYVIGSGVGTSINDIATYVLAASGSSLQPTHVEDRAGGTQVSYHCDITKARTQLTWQPSVSIQDGIQEEWDWMTGSL